MDSIDKADRNFERAISVEPTNADAFYMRGLCAEVRKDLKNAKYFYQQTLNLDSKHELATNGFKRMEKH
jgi:Tfp pilus assembly protein PilF